MSVSPPTISFLRRLYPSSLFLSGGDWAATTLIACFLIRVSLIIRCFTHNQYQGLRQEQMIKQQAVWGRQRVNNDGTVVFLPRRYGTPPVDPPRKKSGRSQARSEKEEGNPTAA
ncbi:hypothetical protein ACFE04_005769 [Oxalis oulophora]